MSRTGDLLELMFMAHARASGVRAVLREWSDTALWLQSARRWAEMAPRGSRSLVSTTGGPARPKTEEHLYKVWHTTAGPRWRVESDTLLKLVIIDGERWWGSDSGGGMLTNVQPNGTVTDLGGSLPTRFIELTFDPASLLAATTLEPGPESVVAGRQAIEATAHWRRGIDLVHIDWPYAEELRLKVDAEYGILLFFETRLDGQPFIRWQVEEVTFGEDMPDSLFVGPADATLPNMGPTKPSPELAQRMIDDLRASIGEDA